MLDDMLSHCIFTVKECCQLMIDSSLSFHCVLTSLSFDYSDVGGVAPSRQAEDSYGDSGSSGARDGRDHRGRGGLMPSLWHESDVAYRLN